MKQPQEDDQSLKADQPVPTPGPPVTKSQGNHREHYPHCKKDQKHSGLRVVPIENAENQADAAIEQEHQGEHVSVPFSSYKRQRRPVRS